MKLMMNMYTFVRRAPFFFRAVIDNYCYLRQSSTLNHKMMYQVKFSFTVYKIIVQISVRYQSFTASLIDFSVMDLRVYRIS